MGDDPLLPEPLIRTEQTPAAGASAATGGSNITVNHGLSKGNQLVVVIIACLALGLSIGAIVVLAWGQSVERDRSRDQLAAVEKRTMDAVYVAQQNAALAREDVRVLAAELNKRGIAISTSH